MDADETTALSAPDSRSALLQTLMDARDWQDEICYNVMKGLSIVAQSTCM